MKATAELLRTLSTRALGWVDADGVTHLPMITTAEENIVVTIDGVNPLFI
jgi:hypothetical protein